MRFTKRFPFLKLNSGLWSRFREGYVIFDVMYARGLGYYDKIKQPMMVATAIGAITYFTDLPLWVLFIFAPVWFFGWFMVGWFDYKHWKVMQRASEWSQRNVNPFEQEVLKRIKNIEKRVKK